MLAARTRALALATLLATSGALAATAAPAFAAPAATIEVDSEVAFVDEPLGAWGQCPTAADTAVLTLLQEDEATAGDTADVDRLGEWESMLDLSDAVAGPGTLTVDCMAYGSVDPLASAEVEVLVLDVDFEFEEIEVAVSTTSVPLGGSLKVSATCPSGATHAVVMAGNEEADEPFFTRELTLGTDGKVSVTVPITKSDSVAPEKGKAVALVVCGTETDLPPLSDSGLAALADLELLPNALGFTEFTITPAVARSAVPAAGAAEGGAARTSLANTGSDNGPLAAIALALIAAGGAAIRLSRRA
jgi:hypothetical protein